MMKERVKNRGIITLFCFQVKQNIKEIDKLNNSLYKKILFSCIIDYLSKIRYPYEINNRKRFVSFIDNYSNWKYKDRVNLGQLYYFFNQVSLKKDKSKSPLYKFVTKNLSKNKNLFRMDLNKIQTSDSEPFIDKIRHLAKGKEKNILELCRYAELVYAYRNRLVHEFCEPDRYVMKSSNIYWMHTYIVSSFDLVFENNLFKILCKRCLHNLRQYLLKEDINPEENFYIDYVESMWRK